MDATVGIPLFLALLALGAGVGLLREHLKGKKILVELIVCGAITWILAAILFPVWDRAMNRKMYGPHRSVLPLNGIKIANTIPLPRET